MKKQMYIGIDKEAMNKLSFVLQTSQVRVPLKFADIYTGELIFSCPTRRVTRGGKNLRNFSLRGLSFLGCN